MLLGLGLAIYLRQSVFPVYGVPLGVDSVVIHLLVFWLVPAIGLGALLSRWKQLSDDVNFFIALAGAWLFAILLTFLWVSREAVLA
jgi:hypothetical protein